MADLTIGALAREGGVGVETVRFYQRRGLLGTPERTHGEGVRRYDLEALRRLQFIRSAQNAGFTLEQIRELLELDGSKDRERAQALARHQLTILDEKIAELEQARGALRKLVEACQHNATQPCPILAAFEP